VRNLLRRLRHDVRGFTSVTVMSTLLVGGLVVTAGFAAADGDITLAKNDQSAKQAYAAAEAGLNVYVYHLNQDNGYWADCTNVPDPNASEPAAVNQLWDGTGSDPRTWRTVPGTNSQYTIELVPATGYSQCLTSDNRSMVGTTGTFKVRITGRSGKVKRSILALFRPGKFIDYIYFTDFETADPVTYGSSSSIAWASANCQKWYRSGRSSSCTSIQFADTDVVAGPFHTNDDILTCGTPTFGRPGKNDAIEVSAPPQGYRTNCGNIVPDFQGTWTPNSAVLTLPPSNSTLNTIAGYTSTGTTRITLNGANMTIVKPPSTTQTTVPIPSNGVVYIKSGTCSSGGYTIVQKYTTGTGCGDAWVSGTTSKNITIGADNDIIINGDLRQQTGSDTLIGLIANNFVRVYHPVSWNSDNDCGSNQSGTMQNVTIEAAILALSHSFIVDNYYCGAKLSNLNVTGAIAQKFRGPVGTGGSSGGTGYIKNYQYDDRMQFRAPPHFLDPVQSAWRVWRYTEQQPAVH
jgi:Tfp pilus assembly protein PilX